MLLNNFIDESEFSLSKVYPRKEAHSIVMMLCRERLGVQSYTHIVDPLSEIPSDRIPALHADVERLSSGEPIQYVLGYSFFCDLRFRVNPDALIPRPETEIMAREAIKIGSRMQRMRLAYGKAAKPVRILDLCTGSGCLAWTLALNIPGAEVTGVDISEKALALASSQDFSDALSDGTHQAPKFIKADILEDECDFGLFDMMVANPPYVRESEKLSMHRNVLDFEPALALFVSDEDPFPFCRAIARIASSCLVPGGKGFVEINEKLGEASQHIFISASLKEVSLIKDYFAKNRFVSFSR